jgi:hypothetical protein
LLVFLYFSVPFSVLDAIWVSKFWHCASNWVCSTENILALGCELKIDCFGLFFVGFGLDGGMLLSLSNPKPLLPGIEPVSACPSVFDHVQRIVAGLK